MSNLATITAKNMSYNDILVKTSESDKPKTLKINDQIKN